MPTSSAEKLPPQNIEAEQSVLGSLLIDKDAIIRIADILLPEDFYKDIHGMIYEAMADLYAQREPIDLVSLSNRLESKKQLEIIGGRAYLAELANMVPTSAHVVHYAEIVQRKSTLRRLIGAASHILEMGYDEEENVDTVLDNAEQSLFAVSQKYLRQNFIPIHTLLQDAFERLDALHKDSSKLRGVPTGYTELDHKLAGLQKSDLVILAARPSMGKTSLMLDIARSVAVNSKIPVGLFSLEMSKEQLVDRLLAAQANVDLWKLRTGKLKDEGEREEFSRLNDAMHTLSEAPLYIDDSAMVNVMEIRTKARRLQSEHGLGLIVIDYLQLMEGRSKFKDNRVQEVAEITRALKGLARELNVPVLALSQLSRAVESRTEKIPMLSDLRESGSIEQDADVVMFIYRPEMYDKNTDRKHIAEIHIAKHRNGPTGTIELFFDQEKVSFKNLDRKSDISELPTF
ncbi:MAG TPA: replicative DNA helicase [Patescibacteria group bacterium]|nr:replicative DNA helicase [Patescibacteria group bacterium]